MLSPLRFMGLRPTVSPLLLFALLSGSVLPRSEATPTDSFSSLSTTAPAGPATCKRLTDADSPFISGLSLLVGVGSSGENVFSDPSVFAALDTALPTVSQCVAQTQPLEVLLSLVSSSSSSPRVLQCWNDLSARSRTRLVDSNGNVLFGDAVCPAFAKLAPCLTDVLLPEIERAMANTGTCCDPLREQISRWFGASLKDAVRSFVHVAGNALCSQRSSIADPNVSENCGDSLQRNWMPDTNGDDEKAYWNFLNAFQIPNDQACKAARSERITTTMNQTQQFGAKDVPPYGICYTPMDVMQQYVRALPLWRAAGGADGAILIERVFVADSCLPGKDLFEWAADDDSTFMKGVRIVDDLLTTVSAVTREPTSDIVSPSVTPAPTTDKPKPTLATTTEPPVVSSDEGSNDDSSRNSEKSQFDTPALFDGTEEDSNGPTLEELAGTNLTELVRAKLWELNLMAEQLCFHIPNGVSCNFPGDVLNVPFPQIEPNVTATTPSPSPSAANSSPANSTASATNGSETNSSSSAMWSQHHERAASVVVVAMSFATLAFQLL